VISIEVRVEYNSLNRSYGVMKREAVAKFERKLVELALTEFKGNISEAARTLKMDRKHLHDLAKRHGLR